jgi:hydrogen cyanide synthase HcnB
MSALDPVIVGAGPAGLSAAITLARYSIRSVLLDESSKVGGVIYRGPLRSADPPKYLGRSYLRTREQLHADYETHRHLIETRLNARIIGTEGSDRLLMLNEHEQLDDIRFNELVVATGCHERSVPFPGWTLPGVMLLGGLQLQIKSALVKPMEPVVLAGSGPLLLLAACQLCRAGVTVAGVYEATPLRDFVGETFALLYQPRLFFEGLGMLAYLKRRGVPVHFGWGIVEAAGTQALEEVVVAPYDRDWRPLRERSRRIAARTLAVGYGFVPRAQLSRMFGLEHTMLYDGAFAPTVDHWQQSSTPNILVVGDVTGIRGAEAAALQGRIAAYAILRRRGVIAPDAADRAHRRCLRTLRRIDRFRAGINRLWMPRAGLTSLPQPQTLICRCENVTRQQVDAAIAQGVQDLVSLKMHTRISMGDCQGKMCLPYCAERLRQTTGRRDVGWIGARFPLDPLPFAALTHGDAGRE